MFETRNRVITPAIFAAVTAIVLGGCSASKDGDPSPPPPTEIAKANFNLATGQLPYPTDLFFAPDADAPLSDGTINIPAKLTFHPLRPAVNALDGWSPSATLDTSFSMPLDAATISGSTVKIVKLFLDPRTKAPANPADPVQAAGFLPTGATSPVAGILTYGTDFTADISDDTDANGKILRITPLKPFDTSTGPFYNGTRNPANAAKVFNIGYLVILTDGLKAADGKTMTPDTFYSDIKAAPADCATFTDATQKAVCQLTKAHLGIAQATGTSPTNIIMSWSFSTQSVDDTFAVISATTAATPTLAVPAFNAALGRILTTKDANAGLQGKANIYLGSTQLPYYLTAPANATDKAAVLTKFWTAAGPPPASFTDQASRNLTMFNPAPKATSTVTVPILVTVPNATSACAGKPVGGYPVAIVQHGITGNRSQALAIADAFADQCFIVAAIDLPLHGITSTSATDPLTGFHCFAPPAAANPACLGAVERTFDVDLVNNSNTGSAVSDGKIDPSGTHFINLSSPLTGRDNLRQGEADLIQFTKSVQSLAIAQAAPGSLPAGPVGVDATRVSFVGLSLGAIVGGSHVHFTNDTRTATLSVPGGVITKLLLDSKSFGPSITAGVNANLPAGSYLFNLFFRDFQTVIDSGDPINHIKDAQAMHPVHLFKVLNDTVVPNNSTDRLIVAGGLRKLKTLGPNAVGPGTGAYTFFKVGSHGTLFDPTASLSATMEMQAQTVSFAASAPLPGGPFVQVGLVDASVLDLQ